MTDDPKPTQVTVLSIDAWRYGDGWTWNAWYKVDVLPWEVLSYSPRKLLRTLREVGVLGDKSKGRVAVEDDGYNIVVLAKGTREPLYALAYGEGDA